MESENKRVVISLPIGAICIICFIVFMILKLCGAVAWSWLIVCIPLIVLGGFVALIFLAAVFLIIMLVIADRKN